jgi:hypothetical protein
MSPVEKQSFGMNGCQLLSSQTSSVGAYCAIQFITAGTITNLVTNSASLVGTYWSSFTFPAGFVLYVPFTQVEIGADCQVVIYRSSQ